MKPVILCKELVIFVSCAKCLQKGQDILSLYFGMTHNLTALYILKFFRLIILHVVNEAKRNRTARWISSVSSENILEGHTLHCSHVYTAASDIIALDAGSKFFVKSI